MRWLYYLLLFTLSFPLHAELLQLATPFSGPAPLKVVANASPSFDPDGKITAYQWFTSNGQRLEQSGAVLDEPDFTPTFRTEFTEPGTYIISLNVLDNEGIRASSTKTIYVLPATADDPATASAPQAVCKLEPNSGPAPLTVTLDGSESTGDAIQTYYWQSSDTREAQGSTAQMDFDAPGYYSLALTVTDAQGLSDTAACKVAVLAPEDSAAGVLPRAQLSTSLLSGSAPFTVTLDASSSSAADGHELVSYRWDSSDGQTADTASTEFTYDAPGYYRVTLTVTDDQGLRNITQTSVSVGESSSTEPLNAAPYSACAITPEFGNVPQTVLLDGRGTFDVDGRLVEHRWLSSDGQSVTGALAALTFNKAGQYAISLHATDNDEAVSAATCSLTLTEPPAGVVQLPPSARFILSSYQGIAPLQIDMDASASYDTDGEIVSYHWLSTQGHERSGEQASMTFNLPGFYRISLRVVDNAGLQSVAIQDIQVLSAAPVETNIMPLADFSITPEYGFAPLEVEVDGRLSVDPDGSIVQYEWLSSYGHSVTGATARLLFEWPGTYNLTLQVTDEEGGKGSLARTLKILDDTGPTVPLPNDPDNLPPYADFIVNQDNWAALGFQPAQSVYTVGDRLTLALQEQTPTPREQSADLWVAVEAENYQLWYLHSDGRFSLEAAPYQERVELDANQHNVLSLLLDQSLRGDYQFYALYTIPGYLPLSGQQGWLSELAVLPLRVE